MKIKIIALFLALTVVSWAQTATQTAPATQQQNTAPAEKGKCPCCDKMAKADATGAPTCCARHGYAAQSGESASCAGKDAKSCCGDAKSCMREGNKKGECCAGCKGMTAANCCGGQCGKECTKGGCCASAKAEKASNCCHRALRTQS